MEKNDSASASQFRLTRITDAGGRATTCAYDRANRLTGLAYTRPDHTPVETLSYTYDENGNLTQRQTAQGPVNYTWDARNRLTRIEGPNGSAAFKYDALGRRLEKTLNGRTTQYLYDGAQAIAELQGSAIGATYLTGLAIDEILARYSNGAERSQLTDALGSIIAQTREDRSIQNHYAYSAYGETLAAGTDEGNASQYTARENDQTGLYYYRARYYDPQLKRFVSEDPIGLAGGDTNLYRYTYNNPVNFFDPSGLWVAQAIGGTLGAIAGAVQAANTTPGGWSGSNWQNIAWGAGTGAVAGIAGATVPATWGWIGSAIAGGAINGAATVANQYATNGSVNWCQAGWQAGIGAVSSGLGWAAGLKGSLQYLNQNRVYSGFNTPSTFNQAIQNALGAGASASAAAGAAAQNIINLGVPGSLGGFVP